MFKLEFIQITKECDRDYDAPLHAATVYGIFKQIWEFFWTVLF